MALALVLVVDGDVAALASVRAVLNAAGYAVDEALNGRQALERVMANPPQVLITEILMPESDGIELITAVKRAYPDIRIIAFAKRRFLGRLDLLDLASKLGADATLAKPLEAESLLTTVAGLVGLDARSPRSTGPAAQRDAGASSPPRPGNCSPQVPRSRRARRPIPGRPPP
jgi:CheY-like chemotaxis protein